MVGGPGSVSASVRLLHTYIHTYIHTQLKKQMPYVKEGLAQARPNYNLLHVVYLCNPALLSRS